MKVLIFDVANILFRAAAMQKVGAKTQFTQSATPEDLAGLSMHVSLQSIHKWYKKYPSDMIVFAFEGDNNWRKKYTKENSTSIRRQYKANRVQDPNMKHYYELMTSFRELMTKHTSICCLSVDGMEGDDVIGGFCQLNGKPDNEINIVSGDKDYVQLLKIPGVHLINPDNGKKRNQPGDKDYQEDIDYWMFLKCVRGDSGDNVPSAFPRVFEKKIKEAYVDPYTRLNFMNETWKDEHQNIHCVGDLFLHNEVLMDLSKQPQEIKDRLEEEIKLQTHPENLGSYSHFHFLKFLGKFQLNIIAEKSSTFIEMFTHNQKFFKGKSIPTQSNVLLKETVDSVKETTNSLMEF